MKCPLSKIVCPHCSKIIDMDCVEADTVGTSVPVPVVEKSYRSVTNADRKAIAIEYQKNPNFNIGVMVGRLGLSFGQIAALKAHCAPGWSKVKRWLAL